MSVDTPAWVRDAVFYQIFPDRFAGSDRVHKPGALEPWDAPPTNHGFKGGDLRGIAERLDYLEDLGVNALYLTPIFSSASNHRYHTYDYFEVDPLLGGDDALRELLDAAHGRGMRVVLDGVFNHTGRGFWPVPPRAGDRARRRRTGTGSTSTTRGSTAGRPLLAYPPPGTPPSDARLQGLVGPAGTAQAQHRPPRGPRVPDDGVAEHWLRFGIDGWRLDVPGEIDDEPFWQEFRRRCRAVRPDAYLVGEVWRVAPEWLRGDRFDALMNYPLGEAILGFAGMDDLDMAIVSTHHEYRLWVRPLDGPAFAAQGDGARERVRPGRRRRPAQRPRLARRAAPAHGARRRCAQRVSWPCSSRRRSPARRAIYYGDEVGLAGSHDPDCRRGFPWDEGRWEPGLRDSVRALLHLRRAERGAARRIDPDRRRRRLGGRLRARRRARRASSWRSTRASEGVRLDLDFEDGVGWRAARADRAAGIRRHRRRRRSMDGGAIARPAGPLRFRPAHPLSRRGTDFGHTRGPVADLPIELGDGLTERLARILDVEAKIPRTFETLGPVGGRDVLLLDGAEGIRARQLTELGARVTFAATNGSSRIDAPDDSADVVAEPVDRLPGRSRADRCARRTGSCDRAAACSSSTTTAATTSRGSAATCPTTAS